jgi:hypothetical protein
MTVASQFIASESFRQSFDKQPFLFSHNLSDHELCTFPALHRLARKTADPQSRPARGGFARKPMTPGFLVAKGRGSIAWGSPEFHQVIDQAFENFEESSIRLKISAVHEYDGYRELLEDCTRKLSEVTGVDFARHYGRGIVTFFISSPGETTPYHIDEEDNFLLQIHGLKQVYIFDGNDRKIVSHKDLEEFWFGRCYIDQVPGSSFKTFDIAPQQGVFNPPFFPHIVKTGPSPCISLSLGFPRLRFKEAEVHRMNAYMRKYGWNPSPPGAKPTIDYLKSEAVRRAISLKRMIKPD